MLCQSICSFFDGNSFPPRHINPELVQPSASSNHFIFSTSLPRCRPMTITEHSSGSQTTLVSTYLSLVTGCYCKCRCSGNTWSYWSVQEEAMTPLGFREQNLASLWSLALPACTLVSTFLRSGRPEGQPSSMYVHYSSILCLRHL